MAQQTDNQRSFERFDMNVPATVAASGEVQHINLMVRDISAGGVFFHTRAPLTEGTAVKVEVFVPNNTIHAMTGSRPLIRAEGIVVRAEEAGMAIQFSGKERIQPSVN
ncbi:MAG: PilZ domain-containing protein [Deltaproteobacteria bacterium]|nr:PilZ domain-containing protein [Deltaproteobacteria bacterium]